jgi:hypothetical protein
MRRTAGVSRQTAQRWPWPGRGVSWRGLCIPGSKASAVIRRPLVSCRWIGCRRGCSAHVALAPCKLPPALDAPTPGLASILVVCCAVTAPPWGCAVLPVGGHLQQALRVQAGHARAWQGWRGQALPLGARRPQTPAGRNGLLVEWSFTAGLCAARAPGAGACSLP